MRNVDDREEKRKEKKEKKEKRMAFLVATTSLPAVYRPNDDRWNAARSCQYEPSSARESCSLPAMLQTLKNPKWPLLWGPNMVYRLKKVYHYVFERSDPLLLT